MGLSINNLKARARHLMIFMGKAMNFILFSLSYSLTVVKKLRSTEKKNCRKWNNTLTESFVEILSLKQCGAPGS